MFDSIICLLNNNMSEQDIVKIINAEDNRAIYTSEILKLTNRVKNGENIDSIIKEISTESDCVQFNEHVINDLQEVLEPFFDLQFVRDWEINKQCDCLKYIFENVLITRVSTNLLLKNTGLNKEELQSVIKVLHTAQSRIIIQRNSEELFHTVFKTMFCFDEQTINYIWQMFDNRRKEIMNYVIMDMYQKIIEIDDNTSKITKFFIDMLDEKN